MKKIRLVTLAICTMITLFACTEQKIHYNELVEIGNEKMYFDEKGQKIKSDWRKINGNWYYFDDQGLMKRDAWIKDSYVGSDGIMLKDVTKKINGKTYIFDSEGVSNLAPDYSAPAPMGGSYIFYFRNTFPLTLPYIVGEWVITDVPTLEVKGNSLTIKGVVEYRKTNETKTPYFKCRISIKDESGLTESASSYLKSYAIKGGERTKFEVDFSEELPLIGRKIYIDFEQY